ncbi:P-type conjugative transfer protein TrbJ, partial [Mesorhizobium sp. M2A.F.Ca.ET.042.01.1.1]
MTPSHRPRLRAVLAATALLATPIALSPIMVTPAHALIVFDPSNYAQN